MKQITFKQYRAIDLGMLCVLTAVFEVIATLATNRWFNLQAMAVSISLSLTCIAILRWNAFAIFPALAGAFALCFSSDASVEQFAVYCGGAIFSILAVPIALKMNKEKIRLGFLRRTAFATITYLCVVIGRWLISLIFDFNPISIVGFLISDILSLLFAILVLYVCKNLDGVIEDQKHYLIRLDEERQAEQKANLNDDF